MTTRGPRIYTRKWTPPKKCECDKVSYRSESGALEAAHRHGLIFDTDFRAYKCPGTSCWHLATRGFHPRSLKSRARIMAWHLTARGVLGRDGLFRELGMDLEADWDTNAGKKTNQIIRAFAELDLITIGNVKPSRLTVTDYEGLRRVMAVGLKDYAAERGMNLTR